MGFKLKNANVATINREYVDWWESVDWWPDISVSRGFEPVRIVEWGTKLGLGLGAAEADDAGGGGDNVVVFECLVRSWLPSSSWKEWGGREVAGAVQREPDGVPARQVLRLPLHSEEEGTEMDLLKPSEPRKKVLRLCGCKGEDKFLIDFCPLFSPPLWFICNDTIAHLHSMVDVAMLNGTMIHCRSFSVI